MSQPDTGGDGGGEGPKKKPRRRGSRGGRGRGGKGRAVGRKKVAGAPLLEGGPQEPGVKAQTAHAEMPVAEAGPIETPPIQAQASIPPTEPVAPAGAPIADAPQPQAPTPSGLPSAFTPGPPRVGMRPAVIRPLGQGRMSFSKGVGRHQFRPSGMSFKPPQAYMPPVTGTPVESGEGAATQPSAQPPVQPPQQNIPPGQHAPQHPFQRGPQARHPQQQQGGSRGGQQHPQQGRLPQGQQGQPQQRGPQRHPPQAHPQGHRGAGVQRPLHGGPRHAPLPHQPAFPVQQPFNDLVTPLGPGEVQGDLHPLPAQPVQPLETLSQGTPAPLMAPTAAETAALAPFAEDIEIEETPAAPAKRREPTGREMLINVVEGEEVRIAVVRRGVLEELYMERSSTESHIGNIYKGRVTNVEPSIQAAFIDFGIGKNGFLHISDLHPQYFPKNRQPNRGQGFGPQRGAPRRGPQKPVQETTTVAPQPNSSGVSDTAEAQRPVEQTGEHAGELAHGVHEESPAVAMEMSPSEVSLPEGSEAGARPITENGGSAESAASSESGSSASNLQNETTSADETQNAQITSAEPPLTEASGEEAPSSEESADFGTAYNADMGEDEEFVDDYEGVDDGHMKPMEKVGRKTPRHDRPPIQQCLRRGQEVIVQVIKEGIGTKGPTLTSYISCPGRYLVMMPGMAQLGVSRKIEDLDQRRELKRTLQELNPPKNLGFIIRTAGTDVSKKELQGDLNYLVRMWKVIANRIRTQRSPVELYQESDLVIRTIRDVFNDEIDRIIVDNEQVASRIRDFLSIVNPRSAGVVELYTGTMPLFQKYGVEREIEKINSRRVEMANGGSLVIDSTEALVAIDVNSGRYREQKDAELTAFNMNKEALKEVCRQLRLRDLGGVIVIDFIDMREERHKREIERLLRDEMKNDRAKTKILRMSLFCMIELTRQRVRPSLKRSLYMDCPHCRGSALIKTPESVALDVMRRLAAGATRVDVARIEVKAYPAVAAFLLNRKRRQLVELEDKTGKRIGITSDGTLGGDQVLMEPYNTLGNLINIVL